MNYFLNYSAIHNTLTVNTFRNNGYANFDVTGLVDDIAMGVDGCCDIGGSLDAVRDGALWSDKPHATKEILEMIDSAICEFHYNNENF